MCRKLDAHTVPVADERNTPLGEAIYSGEIIGPHHLASRRRQSQVARMAERTGSVLLHTFSRERQVIFMHHEQGQFPISAGESKRGRTAEHSDWSSRCVRRDDGSYVLRDETRLGAGSAT